MSQVLMHRAFGLLLTGLCLAAAPWTAVAAGPGEPAQTPPADSASQTPAPAEETPAYGQRIPPVEKDKDGYARGFNFPLAPPDGKWLVDAQGQRYFEHEVPRSRGPFPTCSTRPG